jgi:NUBPL iron-transfer P-loop NTPase
MSRMFELMRQAKLDRELLQRPVATTAATNSRNVELLRQTHKDDFLFENLDSPVAIRNDLALPPLGEHSGGSEVFKLVQRLFLTESALAPRAVVFCPVEQHGENNFTCAQTAELLASHTRGSSVCVMDANLLRPSLHTYFEVENRRGLAEAMLEKGPIAQFTLALDRSPLRLMSAGLFSASADASELLDSGRLRSRMSELRANFDYILIDAPAPSSDAAVVHQLSALVDGFVLVIEPSFTPQQAARTAKDNIEAAGGRVLGVVFHRREHTFGSGIKRHRGGSKPE